MRHVNSKLYTKGLQVLSNNGISLNHIEKIYSTEEIIEIGKDFELLLILMEENGIALKTLADK